MGHARALLSLDSPAQQIKLFKVIQKNGYSVRQVEELVKNTKESEEAPSTKKGSTVRSSLPKEFDVLQKRLSDFFSTKVEMSCSAKGKGKISIPFSNEEELERIINMFDKLKE